MVVAPRRLLWHRPAPVLRRGRTPTHVRGDESHRSLTETRCTALTRGRTATPPGSEEAHRPHAETNRTARTQKQIPPRRDEPHHPHAKTYPPPPHTPTHTHTKMNRTARHNIAPLTMSALVGATTAQRRLSPRCPGKPSRSPGNVPITPFRSPPGSSEFRSPRGEFRSSPGDVPTVPGNVPTLDSHVSSSNPPLHAERCLTTRVTMRPPARTDPSARRGEPGMCPRGFPRAGPDRRSRTRATARKDPTVG